MIKSGLASLFSPGLFFCLGKNRLAIFKSKETPIMSTQVRDYPKLAHEIITLVGGPKNISTATRCATRLRLVLKEVPEDAHDKIGNLPGVITTVEKGGQFQVVCGASQKVEPKFVGWSIGCVRSSRPQWRSETIRAP